MVPTRDHALNALTQPGTHEVKLMKDGYEDYTTSVALSAGETKSISATLKPAYGYLSVGSSSLWSEGLH